MKVNPYIYTFWQFMLYALILLLGFTIGHVAFIISLIVVIFFIGWGLTARQEAHMMFTIRLTAKGYFPKLEARAITEVYRLHFINESSARGFAMSLIPLFEGKVKLLSQGSVRCEFEVDVIEVKTNPSIDCFHY